MHILHVITGLGGGGAEGALYRLVVNDHSNKHTVITLLGKGIYTDRLKKQGIPVLTLNISFNIFLYRAIARLITVMRELKPDVVQTWMYHSDLIGGLSAWVAGIRTVVWGIRGPYNKERTSFSTKVVVYFCVLLSRLLPNIIISNSHFAKEAHVKIGYLATKFAVIPNGYMLNSEPLSNTDRIKFCQQYGIKNDVLILGMVSRFDPHKDHTNLLSSLNILSARNVNFVCLLVGTGMSEDNKELLSLLDKHHVKKFVRMVGTSDQIPEIMSLLDVHILSSVAESFPNVLAEAMIMGTPCVTTDVGDAKIIVADTGWVVPAESPELLADAVEEASVEMKNQALWSKRQNRCRERIEENYSLERMISAYRTVWKEVVSE